MANSKFPEEFRLDASPGSECCVHEKKAIPLYGFGCCSQHIENV